MTERSRWAVPLEHLDDVRVAPADQGTTAPASVPGEPWAPGLPEPPAGGGGDADGD